MKFTRLAPSQLKYQLINGTLRVKIIIQDQNSTVLVITCSIARIDIGFVMQLIWFP